MCVTQQLRNSSFQFVPKHIPVCDSDVKLLSDFLKNFERILIATGAGISTESGIPDYRSHGVGLYARSNSRPMLFKTFMESTDARQRYWARNYVGWPRFSSYQPNNTHDIIKRIETECKRISCVITQNVDSLHHKAGSKNVIELHGKGRIVVCLSCGLNYDRNFIQSLLKENNPNMIEFSQYLRPDGDVELKDEDVCKFTVPPCPSCKCGILKPDVVFFGENVPQQRVIEVDNEINKCESLLVLGSSLSTYSGYRIAMKCKEMKKPLGIINIGQTRADNLCDFKIERRCGELLSKLDIQDLCSRSP